jgi:hypothetical protein
LENSEFFYNETGIALKVGATLIGNVLAQDSHPKDLLMIKYSGLSNLRKAVTTFIHESNPYANLIPGTAPGQLTESQFNNNSQIPFNMVVSQWCDEDESQISIGTRDIEVSGLRWMGVQSETPKPYENYSTTNFADWNQDAVKRLQSLNLSRKIKELLNCINILRE